MNLPTGRRNRGRAALRAAAVAAIVLPALCGMGCVSPPKVVAPTIPESADPAAVRLRNLARSSHAAFLEECLAHYRQSYRDYRCTLTRQERLGGLIQEEQEIAVKFKDSPFSVAMAWVRKPGLGDRMLYVEGKYGGQMLVRPTGGLAQLLAGKTVRKDPNAEDVRKQSLRRVDEFGFQRSMISLLGVYRLAAQRHDLREELGPDAEVLGRRTFVLVRHLPENRDYPAARTVTYIDQEWLVPILVEGYGWRDGEFLCRYFYKDIRFNTGLTDDDFLPENNDLQTPGPPPGKGG